MAERLPGGGTYNGRHRPRIRPRTMYSHRTRRRLRGCRLRRRTGLCRNRRHVARPSPIRRPAPSGRRTGGQRTGHTPTSTTVACSACWPNSASSAAEKYITPEILASHSRKSSDRHILPRKTSNRSFSPTNIRLLPDTRKCRRTVHPTVFIRTFASALGTSPGKMPINLPCTRLFPHLCKRILLR